jgi:probable F420-dependent oxidoreductase
LELGFTSMNTPEDIPPAELARALEARGFDSLWVGEHSHIPTSRKTPYPTGGEMPAQYRRMMDPFVSLTAAAAATERLLVGTGVALPLEHDLFDLAKTVTTLDRIAGGRFLFGVGAGWNEEELANHRPIPWAQRYRALAECVAALRALWCDDESAFHGRYYDFDPVWSHPKPLTQPHPPVLCGMGGRLGTKHAAGWADAWMPMDIALGNVARRVTRFREAVAAAGRDDVPITIVTWGDPGLDTLKEYRDLGIERAVIGAARQGWDDPASTYPFIDRYASLLSELQERDR